MQKMTIGALAQRAGLRPSTLRYYEEIGILPKADRENGQRRYDDSILEHIRMINLGKRVGFSLEEIREILRAGLEMDNIHAGWKMVSPAKIKEIDAQIEQLIAVRALLEAGVDCDCKSLHVCGVLQVD